MQSSEYTDILRNCSITARVQKKIFVTKLEKPAAIAHRLSLVFTSSHSESYSATLATFALWK